MNDHPLNRDHHHMGAQMQNALTGWSLHLDMLEGLVRQTTERGWTEEQARRIVAGTFGGRPTDGGDE